VRIGSKVLRLKLMVAADKGMHVFELAEPLALVKSILLMLAVETVV
jgi:hypothetical protein